MRTRSRKLTALFFLVILSVETLVPGAAYALTTGPAQPEMQQFQPAGASDLVDLFTGDLKYNIPLGDVDGYPLNLAYQSGVGMEDEASWVGAGWSLNPGSITRDVRGLPDDFDGEHVKKEYYRKPFRKVGVKGLIKTTALAWEIGKAGFYTGVYKDNYYGIGAEVGGSIEMQLGKAKGTALTAGLGIDSDTRNGLSLTPSLSLSRNYELLTETVSRSLSGSLVYNTRSGLKQVELGGSFATAANLKHKHLISLNFSATRYFGQSYTPSLKNNSVSTGYTLSYDGGVTLFGLYLAPGASGYYYSEKVADNKTSAPAYGYLNYLKGRDNVNALIDFNREKDGVFIPGAQSIPIPVATPDFFSATSQTGSVQFRPYFGGNYVVFDNAHENTSVNLSGGVTMGLGNLSKKGGRISFTAGGASSHKWRKNNDFLNNAEASFVLNGSPADRPFYFKATGELTESDKLFTGTFNDERVGRVEIGSGTFFKTARTTTNMMSRVALENTGSMRKTKPEKNNHAISYLTAAEASRYGLDKLINGTLRNDGRQGIRKPHHLSEISVTDDQGKRMVYGIPVYNREQHEVMFSVGKNGNTETYEVNRRNGLVPYVPGPDGKPDYHKGRDEVYSRESMPSYPTSFLLTGILSPDYVDIKGDGISDDDLGSAVKFGYEQLSGVYHWRAPYVANSANYNEGFVSDPLDDKGSYVYGNKEIWYLKSIESKTMIAVFETSPREDGMGVAGEHGGRGGVKLKKLDRIKIYSKADYVKNILDISKATPFKVVHFEYDYSLFPQMANNSQAVVPLTTGSSVDLNAAKGKLTLKKVYFTFGNNTRGKSNPYEFEYDLRLISTVPGLPAYNGTAPSDIDNKEKNDLYVQRQQDRWGTYKHSRYNTPATDQGSPTVKLNNSEFPYTIQKNDDPDLDEKLLADRYASKWQLTKVYTPTGSTIEIEYEADDYAFVQNRRAMQMCFVKDVWSESPHPQNELSKAKGLKIALPFAVPATGPGQSENFKNMYLKQADGDLMKFLYFKVFCKLNNKGAEEYVQGYAELNLEELHFEDDGHTVFLGVKRISDQNYNPIARAGWQMMKTDLPQFFYNNYDNTDARTVGDNFSAAIKSLAGAFWNITELGATFEKTGYSKGYVKHIVPDKSMVRLCNPTGHKLGGGARVKRVILNDQWENMAGVGAKSTSLGQQYEYETEIAGTTVSSGVASYEPSIGNEENPFHEPIPFTEDVHLNADRYHYVELPYCETYFPAPVVGYSKVTVTSLGVDDIQQGGAPAKHVGHTENEFYTARDFPTMVDYLPLDQNRYESSLLLQLFSSTSVNRVSTSQGFKVELNDMHGKPKSVKVYDKGTILVSAVENFYNVWNDDAEVKQLKNDVDVLADDGKALQSTLGTTIDFTTDVRESSNETGGSSVGAYAGTMILPLPPPFTVIKIPYVAVNFSYSITADSYNSISTVKVVHKYGIIKRVKTTQNGSSIEAENLVWDGETGNVVLTRTQNEFNDYTYAFTYPAHLAEKGMAGAYYNQRTLFMNFEVDPDGVIDLPYKTYLAPGDELGALDEDKKVWVISSAGGDSDLRLINEKGEFTAAVGRYMVLRSGRRNLTGASVGSVVCMNDPRTKQPDGSWKLELGADKRILDAKAIVYNNKWAVPVANQMRPVRLAPNSEYCPGSCLWDFLFGSIIKVMQSGSSGTKRGLFASQADNVLIRELMLKHNNRTECEKYTKAGEQFYDSKFYLHNIHTVNMPGGVIRYEIQPGDVAQFGELQIVFDEVHEEFNDLLNSNMSEAAMKAHLDETPIAPGLPTYCLVPESFDDDIFHTPSDRLCTDKMIFRKIFNCTTYPQTRCDIGPCSHTKLLKWHLVAPPEHAVYVDDCTDPLTTQINPYTTGLMGNWRPEYAMAYAVDRAQQPALSYQNGGSNVRYSGYYKSYDPFWLFSGDKLQRAFSPEPHPDPKVAVELPQRWIWASKSVYFDQKGNEVESMVPLTKEAVKGASDNVVYNSSAALFGYKESVAIAIGSNARRNEIAFDGFEDYGFELQRNLKENCPTPRHFEWGLKPGANSWCFGSNCITAAKSHSGKYSLNLNGILTKSVQAGNAAPAPFLGFDANGRYRLLSNELVEGFRPVNGKKYLLSFWMLDNAPTSNKPNGLSVRINGQPRAIANMTVPVVEEWKQVQLEFTGGSSFDLQLIGSNVYIDDVRILPVDGQLTSFVYDDVTLRLMAQLDENNFATFYEYDDEGTPIRVKRETERGVMTIKENRKYFKKKD